MESKKNKSQSSLEFIILSGFVLFLFVIFFIVIQGGMRDKTTEKNNLEIKELALNVQDEINLALESSEGYYREFKLPDKIFGRDYDIQINENMVYIKTRDNKYALALPVKEVTGNLTNGTNVIKKQNGVIYLNE